MSHVKRIISQELTEAGITKGFQSAVEEYRSESLKLQDLRDEQDELVSKFKKSSPAEKEKLKKDLIAMHKKVQAQKKTVDRAESKFNKMVMAEPEELEESRMARRNWWKKFDKKELPTPKHVAKEGDWWVVEVPKPNSDKYLIGLGKTKKAAYEDALAKAYQSDVNGWMKESVNEASMDFYAIKDGKVFRTFPSRTEATKWLRDAGSKYSGVSLRSKKDWDRYKSQNEATLHDYSAEKVFNAAKQQVAKKLGVKPMKVSFSQGRPAGGGMFQGIYTVDGNDFFVKLDKKGNVRTVKDESKKSNKRLTEALSKDSAKKLYKMLKQAEHLADLKKPLEQAGFTSVEFKFNPFPHFKIKDKGKDTIVVTNTKFVKNPEIEVNDIAAGIVEGVRVVKESKCGSCDEYKSRLVEEVAEMDMFPESNETIEVYPEISDFVDDVDFFDAHKIFFSDGSEMVLIDRNNTVRMRPKRSIADMMKRIFDQTDITTDEVREMLMDELPKSKLH